VVTITHKEKFCIIVYNLFVFIFNKLGVKIKVAVPSEGSENGESTKGLIEDFLSVFTRFVAKYHGHRAAENRRRRKGGSQEEDQNNCRKERNRDPSLFMPESMVHI
jgi:predicted site-specific integrase-resolvase